MNRVHACTKYEQDPLNIVGVYSGNEGGTDWWTDGAGHDNTHRPEWAEGKNTHYQ